MLVKGLQPFSVYAARFRINPMALSALKSVEKQIPDLSKMLEDPQHLVKGFVTLTYSPNVPRELKAKTVDLHRAQVLPDVLQRSILLPLLHAPPLSVPPSLLPSLPLKPPPLSMHSAVQTSRPALTIRSPLFLSGGREPARDPVVTVAWEPVPCNGSPLQYFQIQRRTQWGRAPVDGLEQRQSAKAKAKASLAMSSWKDVGQANMELWSDVTTAPDLVSDLIEAGEVCPRRFTYHHPFFPSPLYLITRSK